MTQAPPAIDQHPEAYPVATLGGFTVPAERDGQCWHDLAMERARVEGIPLLTAADLVRHVGEYDPCGHPTEDTARAAAEVQAILKRHGITRDAIEAHIDAEQAGIAAGTVVPLRPRK